MSYTSVPADQLIPIPTVLNDTHKDFTIAIAIIILGIVACFAVIARLIQRYILRNFGADDYAMVFALILYIAWTAMAAWFNLNSGIGKPIGEITYGEFIVFYKGVFVAAWMYPIMSAAIRVSVLLLYRRIFAKGNKFYTLTIWILIFLQSIYVIIFEITPGFSCHPIQDAWEPVRRLTSCSDLYITSTIALYSVSLAFDFILLVFPIYAISKLQMPTRKRLGVVLIFVLGASASIVAVYKLGIFEYETSHWEPTDPTWFNYEASSYIPVQYNGYGKMYWIPTQLEPTVAMIGTSLPALLQVYSTASLQFSKLRSTLSSRRRSEGSKQTSHGNSSLRHRVSATRDSAFQKIANSEVELRDISSHPSSLKSDRVV